MSNTTRKAAGGITVQHISTLLLQAIGENSHLESDWLWYASQVTSVSERSYCLTRALQINPHNKLTQRDLAALRGEAAPAKPTRSSFYQLSVPG